MHRLLNHVSVLCLLAPGAALADVTPKDVWANIGAAVTAMGGEISADLSGDGDRLEASDIRILFKLPQDFGRIEMASGDMTFTANGNGTVALGSPPEQAFSLSADIAGEGGVTLAGRFSVSDYTTTAAGDPGNITYSYDIGRYAVEFTDLDLHGKAADDTGGMRMDGGMELTGLSGNYSIQEGDLLRLRSDGVIDGGRLDYGYEIGAPGAETMSGRSTATLGAMTGATDLRVPAGGVSAMALGQAFRDGFLLDYGYSVDRQVSEQTTMLDDVLVMRQVFDVGRSEGTMIVGMDGLRLDAVVANYSVQVEQPDLMPTAIDFTIRRTDALMAFPFLKSDTPQLASIKLDLAGVTMGDAVWALFDPEASLPRDPARLLLDLTAQVLWRADAVDFAAMRRMEETGEMPVELHALKLNNILLTALGTETTATGAFSVDNDDTGTFAPGLPTPDGRAEIRLAGVMALLDRLVDMGLMSTDDAMVPRMMLGGFAKQDAEDSYVSEIVVDGETGQVTAGGQRLK